MNGPRCQHKGITGPPGWQLSAVAFALALCIQGAHDVRRAVLPDVER
jgi:hypothetical protein